MIIYRWYKNVSIQATDHRSISRVQRQVLHWVLESDRMSKEVGAVGSPKPWFHTFTQLTQTNISWLVVWNIFFIFHILGMSLSQLTNSIIFQRDGLTTKQCQGVDGKIQCVLELERLVGIRYFWPPMEAGFGDGICASSRFWRIYSGSFHGYVSYNQRVYIIIWLV